MSTKDKHEGAVVREWALQTAAQCWCDPETSDRVMDDKLAMAFAKRLEAERQAREAAEAELALLKIPKVPLTPSEREANKKCLELQAELTEAKQAITQLRKVTRLALAAFEKNPCINLDELDDALKATERWEK